MILYHVITAYHLLCAITKHASEKQEKAVLLMPQWIVEKFPHHDALVAFFDYVVIHDANYRFRHEKEDTAVYFHSRFPSLADFSAIYVWGAQFSFGVFLAEQKIPFIYCEEACGMLSRSHILEHIEDMDPLKGKYYDYVKSLGLYTGDCSHVVTNLCNIKAQEDGFVHDNLTDFDVVETLALLQDEQRGKIISFFTDVQTLTIPQNSTIIFTQHFANLRLTTFQDQALLYQLFVDYFFPQETLVFKVHPDDVMYYTQLFPKSQVIRQRFPSEFLPFLVDRQPKCVATVYSTAIYSLRGQYSHTFVLDQRFETEFGKAHRYYMALYIAQTFSHPIFYLGTNEVLLQKLWQTWDVPSQRMVLAAWEKGKIFSMPCTIIVDDLTPQGECARNEIRRLLREVGEDVVVIFTNTGEDYCWYDYADKALWEHITPIVLKKRRIPGICDELFFASTREEQLYLYTKNDVYRKQVNALQTEKELPHVGLTVVKEPQTETEERIKLLEGMLAATEQRLLYYIQRVKEWEKDK